MIIANAPDPVFVSDLEGKILQANDAVSQLLGFRPDELVEQSLSKFISPEEAREFTAALREVVAKGVTRDARLSPRSASGEVIPTTLNASALRDPGGRVIGAIGILRDMRELDKAREATEIAKKLCLIIRTDCRVARVGPTTPKPIESGCFGRSYFPVVCYCPFKSGSAPRSLITLPASAIAFRTPVTVSSKYIGPASTFHWSRVKSLLNPSFWSRFSVS
jgi:PAS domain S-box-containing protein